jgi:hypothetical protein
MKQYQVRAAKRPTDQSLHAQLDREVRRVARLEKVVMRETKRLRAARFKKQVLLRMANAAKQRQLIEPLPTAQPKPPVKPGQKKKVTKSKPSRDNVGPKALRDIFKL